MKFDMSAKRTRISNDEMLEDLRRFAATIGNRSFSLKEFDAWPERRCRASTIMHRFGRWRAALRAIDVEMTDVHEYTPEELMEKLEHVWRILGRPPGFEKLYKIGHITPAPYLRRWGTLKNACDLLARYKAGRISKRKLLSCNPRPRRAPIHIRTRWIVLRRDRYRCTLCGKSPATDPSVELEVDHITPVSRGGKDDLKNLRTLCMPCNRAKSDKMWDEKKGRAA